MEASQTKLIFKITCQPNSIVTGHKHHITPLCTLTFLPCRIETQLGDHLRLSGADPGERPQSGSKPSIWSHLWLPGPDPGQETRKWLQTVRLEPSVAPWARSGPGDPKVAPQNVLGLICGSRASNRDCQTLDCFTPDYYKPHTGHTMVGKCRPHDYRPRTHHTIAGHTQATRRPHD